MASNRSKGKQLFKRIFARISGNAQGKTEAASAATLKEKQNTKILSAHLTETLYDRVYHISYYLGAYLLRKIKIAGRAVFRLLTRSGRIVKRGLSRAARVFLSAIVFLAKEISGPFIGLVRLPIRFCKVCWTAIKKRSLKTFAEEFKNTFRNDLRAFLQHVAVVASYAAPIAAVCCFVATLSAHSDEVYAVRVSYNGEVIGYIRDESVYIAGEEMMQERIIYAEGEEPYTFVPEFALEHVSEDIDLADEYDICNSLIRANSDTVTEAYGLYINGTFMGATTDNVSLENTLDELLNSYSLGIQGEKIEFVDDVIVKPGLYPDESIVSYRKLENLVTTEVQTEKTYTIVANDNPIKIAAKNNITLAELVALNPDIEKTCLIGQEVLIANSKPFLGVRVTVVEGELDEIEHETLSITDNRYNYGYKSVLVKGEDGEVFRQVERVYVDGVLEETNVMREIVLKEPVTEQVLLGTYIASSIQASRGNGTYDGTFIWPVDGGYISCSIYGYQGHTGTDIAAYRGTNVRASADGTVIKVAKQNYGYGWHIIIDHGNGVQTLYAHNSKLLVSVGDKVEQGDIIAKVGTTGNSSGDHCHFEIRMNGRYMDAREYIGYVYPGR